MPGDITRLRMAGAMAIRLGAYAAALKGNLDGIRESDANLKSSEFFAPAPQEKEGHRSERPTDRDLSHG